MIPIEQIIEAALSATQSIGLATHHQALQKEKTQLLEPAYRVAFVGQFKAGKSTLINRLLLKERILFTDVREATSIPTELIYAETPRLEVYRYVRKSFSVPLESGAIDQSYISDTALDRTVENPSIEDVRKAVSADTAEERAALAKTFSRARLFWPAANLRQFTVIDTPGINSTTEAVVTTTYQILPTCDVAVYVATLRQLATADLSFLRNHVFDGGLTRTLVLLNYDPDYSESNPAHIENIRRSVQAQLAQIGRNVPVHVAEMPRKGGLPAGELGGAVTKPGTGNSRQSNPSQTEACGATPIERTLIDFFRDNVRPGREEKARILVRRSIEKALAACKLELNLLEQSDTKRAQELAEQMRSAQAEQDAKRETLKLDLLSDLKLLLREQKADLQDQLNQTKDNLLTGLDGCTGLAATREWLMKQQQDLPAALEIVPLNMQRSLRTKIRDLEARYGANLRRINEEWNHSDPTVDVGFLQHIPGFALTTLDLVLKIATGPFGNAMTELIPRLLTAKLGLIQEFLPAILGTQSEPSNVLPIKAVLEEASKAVVKYFKENSRSSINAYFETVSTELNSKLAEAIEKTTAPVKDAWDQQTQANALALTETLERGTRPADPIRLEALRNAMKSLTALLSELPSVRESSSVS